MHEILHHLLHALKHTGMEALKLLPFLFLTYLIMELLEHKAGEKMRSALQKSGRFGPLFGSLLGAVPQCGFSAASAGFYSGRVITLGTLIAVFLSTSDEMIPVAISENVSPLFILKLVGVKVVLGMVFGFLVDLVLRRFLHKEEQIDIGEICEEEHCHCHEKGIWLSTLHHTVQVGGFLILVVFCLNTLVEFVGHEALGSLFVGLPVLGPLVAALIGLIPNCAASVVVTQLYLEGVLSAGSLLAGLLSGAGVGLLILFRTNRHRMKENFLILGLVYVIGSVCGIVADLLNFGAFLA